MRVSLVLAVVVGVLMGTGVYLLLARSTIRSLLGLLLISNGANLLFLIASGPAGRPPIIGITGEAEMADPVPQAMALTAIVITLAMTAFILALALRAWQLSRTDVVADDSEALRIAEKAERRDTSDSDFVDDHIESDSSQDVDLDTDAQGEAGEQAQTGGRP